MVRVRTTSDYDRQDYFQILCCGRDIVVTILKLKCRKIHWHCLLIIKSCARQSRISLKNQLVEFEIAATAYITQVCMVLF